MAATGEDHTGPVTQKHQSKAIIGMDTVTEIIAFFEDFCIA